MSEQLYNLNIERAVLSSVFFEPYTQSAEYILNSLSSKDFYLPFHMHLFATIQDMTRASKPIDEEFVRIALNKNKNFDEVAMLDVMSANPISNVASYVAELKEFSRRRALLVLSTTIKKEILEDGKGSMEMLEYAIKKSEHISEDSTARIRRSSIDELDDAPPEFICRDWLPIPKGTLSMLVAPGGTGKTWLALQLALRSVMESPYSKVFCWFSEDPAGTIKSRYIQVKDNILGLKDDNTSSRIDISTDDPILLLDNKGRMSNNFYTLKRELKEYDVIILDPLLAFYGGDENDNAQARVFMQPFLNWARSENKSIVFLHHSKKGDGVNASRARGAGAIVDAVRCVYDIDKIYSTKSGKSELDIHSTHLRKINLTKDNYGAIKLLGKYSVEREITPRNSAPSYVVEYEDIPLVEMPRIV